MVRRLFICIFILPAFVLFGQDTQWRGPHRNGIYEETGLLKVWPVNGPELLLKKEGLGGGYSTPLFYKDVVYVTGRRDTLEVITALRIDGTILWETVYGKPWMESFQETRNTPAIENDTIYVAGAMGTVACIDALNGKIIWSVNTHDQYRARFHKWGMAESVLLTDRAVISSPAGAETVVVALDKKDGSLLWKTETIGDVRSYVSPLMIEHNGIQLILATTSRHLLGISPENGEIFWKVDLIAEFTTSGRRNNTNTPLYHNGEIFYSSGYDDTAVMLKLSDDSRSVTVKWTSDVLDVHHGGMVLVDGYIYGSNWLNNGNGNWVCLDWDNGKVMYEEKWHNKGAVIYADGHLYVYEEKQGNVALVKPTPLGFKVISSFQITDGKGPHWAHPSIYNGKLFMRHTDVLLIFDIKDKS